MNVKTRACSTNMEKVLVSRTPAWRPIFNTISSTRLRSIRPSVSPHSLAYIRVGNIPFAAHEGANGARLAVGMATYFCSDSAWQELGGERDDTQQDCVPPGDAVIQEAQVCPKTRKGKVLEITSQPSDTLREDRP